VEVAGAHFLGVVGGSKRLEAVGGGRPCPGGGGAHTTRLAAVVGDCRQIVARGH